MGDCNRIQNQISDFLEKELDPGMHAIVENHLAVCSQCNMLIAEIPAIQSILGNLQSQKCSEEFNLKLQVRLQQETSAKPNNFQIKKYSFAFSFVMIIIAGVFIVNSLLREETEFTPAAQVLQNGAQNVSPSVQPSHQVTSASNIGVSEGVDIKTKDIQKTLEDSAEYQRKKDEDRRMKLVDQSK